ncbi:hypothetical protein TCAL_08215 [Tigriopus californicus]|uniref:Kinetochore protein Nuf2 N-terminal domain-containing protein n=1 Tax=Tigriopus californicus TaxID=6832 RepID=A0A553NCR7_TIGCA|nr:hypothetical protein TCAL_08215 [Tigriopus californicus]
MEEVPLVSINDIVGFLNEILEDESFSKTDLTSPTAERIQMLYFKLLLEFGFTEKILQPVLDHLGPQGTGIQHSELLQDTDHLDALIVACQYFFSRAYPGSRVTFGLLDLIEPESKRTRQFVSGMRNFYLLCNLQHVNATNVKDEVHASKEKMMAMKNEMNHIIEMLNKTLMDLDQNKLLIVSRLKSDDVKQELGQELDNLKEKFEHRTIQEQEMKRKLAEHEEKNRDIANLFGQVDTVAEKYDKNELQELKMEFDNSTKDFSQEEMKRAELTNKVTLLQEESRDVEGQTAWEKEFVLNEYAKLLEAIKSYKQKFVKDMKASKKILESF